MSAPINKERLCVAFLTHEPFWPPSGGGSSEAVYLVRELVRRGHEVHLFCPEFERAEEVCRDHEVVPHLFTRWKMGRYARLRNFKYLLYPRFLAAMAVQAHRAQPFDLAVAQHTISSVAGGWFKRQTGCRLVMNYLDFLTGFMEAWPKMVMPPPALNVLKRFEMSLPGRFQADLVLTVSDALAKRLRDAGCPKERLKSIYFGYDAQVFPLRSEQQFRESLTRPPVVLMHGSFDQHHLGPIALRALSRVAKTMPEVTFRFVGRETPSLQSFVARLRERAGGPLKVELVGFTPYGEIAEQLALATVGIVPYEETSGGHCAFVAKLVEYLGVGVPVVSTRLEGVAGYFSGEPMIQFTDFDGDQFANAILERLKPGGAPSYRQAAEAGARVARELDWSVVTGRAVDAIESAASIA